MVLHLKGHAAHEESWAIDSETSQSSHDLILPSPSNFDGIVIRFQQSAVVVHIITSMIIVSFIVCTALVANHRRTLEGAKRNRGSTNLHKSFQGIIVVTVHPPVSKTGNGDNIIPRSGRQRAGVLRPRLLIRRGDPARGCKGAHYYDLS